MDALVVPVTVFGARMIDAVVHGRARLQPMQQHDDRDRWSPSALEPCLDWTGILRVALEQLGGTASLMVLHAKLERELFPRTQLSIQTKAKLRKALERDPLISRVSSRVWRLSTPSTKSKGTS